MTLKAAAIALGLAALPGVAPAQTDEIQVYDAAIAAPGQVNLTLHSNYTPSGLRTPAFPGGFASAHAFNGVPEFALGVTPWMEAGLYLPLYSITPDGRAEVDGFKLRALFVSPDAADRTVFYGVNFEFSVNARHWSPSTLGGEIRPILGVREGRWTFIVNPILDTDYTGLKNLDFAPESRVAYRVSPHWTVAAEEYDDFGPVRRFLPGGQQTHELFGVVDFGGKPVSVEFGVGFGLTPASDRTTLKLILSKDL